jgi:hypothetical protein
VALGTSVDWAVVGSRAGFLAALMIVCAWFATRALRVYQRSARGPSAIEDLADGTPARSSSLRRSSAPVAGATSFVLKSASASSDRAAERLSLACPQARRTVMPPKTLTPVTVMDGPSGSPGPTLDSRPPNRVKPPDRNPRLPGDAHLRTPEQGDDPDHPVPGRRGGGIDLGASQDHHDGLSRPAVRERDARSPEDREVDHASLLCHGRGRSKSPSGPVRGRDP